MAAVLKKRALAEYSQVIQEETSKPPKKLRLTKRSKPLSWSIDLSVLGKQGCTPQETLQILMQLAEYLPSQAEDAIATYTMLLEHLPKEKSSLAQIKILHLVGELCRIGDQDPNGLLDELNSFIKVETSHRVILQMLEMLLDLTRTGKGDVKFHQRLLQLANQHLAKSDHLVKCKCLEILSNLIPADVSGEPFSSTLKLLADFSHSQDPRVRTAALQAVFILYERGLKIDMSIYNDVTQALNDDYEGVRIAALKLLVVISQAFSESLVPVPDSQEHIHLIDDAFAKVCNAINDLSLTVRTQAAQLLGTMTGVSARFLEQTLDKRLMSNMRRKHSAHERQKETYQSGEWSSGQKWADDAPREALDAETVNLISTGACGAMVHGLEDEYLEVRSATLDSLCQLALLSPSFANLSIDFLVDMFNDEIEDVRLKAIHCLTKISNLIVLREDQLETILAVLEDFSMDIREGLHGMLSNCHLSTKACLKMCVDNLLENLKRYPQDKRSIWKCLQHLGMRHSELTLPLVTELLSIHPYFDTPEPDMDDPAYISILILVFNSAATCPTMIPLFEQHTRRHYSYLRDSLPHLVPHLKFLNLGQTQVEITSVSSNTTAFLQQVLDKNARAEKLNARTRHRLQETAIQDLQRLAQIDPSLSASANCASYYIHCQLLFAKILQNKNWCNASALALLHGNTVKNAVEQLLQTSFRLVHMFIGLSPSETATILQLRLKVFALHLVYIVRGSNASALALCEHFLNQIETLQRFLWDSNLCADSFIDAVFREMDQLEDPKPGPVARILQPLLQSYHSPALRLTSNIYQVKATIYEPTGESDTPLKFTAGLLLGVTFDAEIENVEDLKNIRIKVKYPDQQTQLILPRLNDFRDIDSHRRRLMTTVLLSHSVWSEACHVELNLVLDFSESEAVNIKSHQKTSSKSDEHTIDLCKPVKICISPKPIKKGI